MHIFLLILPTLFDFSSLIFDFVPGGDFYHFAVVRGIVARRRIPVV